MQVIVTKGWHFSALGALVLSACSINPSPPPGTGHLRVEDTPQPARNIPAPVQNTVALPKPKATPRIETYSVVVNNVKVQDLLFALARDARINVDIHPGISGYVTLNAIDQTLQQLLSRIAKQVDIRWELDGPNLAVMPDSPFLRTYKIDYVNMTRDTALSMTVTPQVGTATAGSTGGGGNTSTTKIEDVSKNRFWETLDKNIKDLLHETDKVLPSGSSETVTEHQDQQSTTGTGAQQPGGARSGAQPGITGSPNPATTQQQGATVVRRNTFREAASVIMNPESGIVTVRATGRQHEKVQEFLDQVMTSARRQVLIEATIAEVQLSQNYQQGVDWQKLTSDSTARAGLTLTQANPAVLAGTTGGALLSGTTQVPTGTLTSLSTASGNSTGSLFTMALRQTGGMGNFAVAVKLLESFGNVKVLSSPKVSVLNNQTAMLNVGSQVVYFKVTANTTTSSTGLAQTTVDTTPQTASVGLLMSVTPQISGDGTVLLNVRPSISRVVRFKQDPNPNIPAGITNQVPEIERREMESMLRIADGDIAVLGGLMQDSIDHKDDGVPGLSSLPVIGNLFSYKNQTNTKTELVIFLRPTIIRDASIQGDYRSFREALPDKDFLKRSWEAPKLGESFKP